VLKYYLQQFFFQIILAVAAILLVGAFLYSQSVQVGEEPPADVREQFKHSLGKPAPLTSAKVGEVDLSLRHMSAPEIASLLDVMIAEVLSFTPSNYDRNTALVQNYFTPGGYAQYKQYLTTAKLGETIKTRQLQSGVFNERPPLEINAQVQNGVFKWLYEVPVTMSFISAHAETYRGGATKPQNQRFTLRLQLTRVKDDKNPNKIAIEIWQMQAPRG
jgi:hypothetical protein